MLGITVSYGCSHVVVKVKGYLFSSCFHSFMIYMALWHLKAGDRQSRWFLHFFWKSIMVNFCLELVLVLGSECSYTCIYYIWNYQTHNFLSFPFINFLKQSTRLILSSDWLVIVGQYFLVFFTFFFPLLSMSFSNRSCAVKWLN